MIAGVWLTWALVAVSLGTTILLLWLGLTLWLNADRREWGVLVAAAGFFLGGAFFVSHSALLLSDTLQLTRSNSLWLAVGLAPAVLLPYVWYVVLLWYNGYWNEGSRALRRRHRWWLRLSGSLVAAGLAGLVLLGSPFLPLVGRLPPLVWSGREFIKTPVLGIPLVALIYPLYVLLCVVLSLDTLRRPGVTARALGDAARQRAKPWLVSATVLLLLVGALVAAVVLWTITHTRERGYYILTPERLEVIGQFDLVISVLIGAVIVLLGQAMTAYELFSGRTLPRQGLARQWKGALGLAAGYGALMGGALVVGLEPVYGVLLTAVLMTAFFALLSWRSSVEWEQTMRQLRPFVASQRWYDTLVHAPPRETRQPDPFRALCEEVLHTTVAHLIPVGPTAAFVPAQHYPAQDEPPSVSLGSVGEGAPGDARLIAPVEPEQHGGATWAVPLWHERGAIGVLLLGPRHDGGLYTQEEIEIARATGERLIDTAASLALSQRLMLLQRERMAATQILDQRTRRVLHDEVLPLIHTAMLALAAGEPGSAVIGHLTDAHAEVAELLRELPPTVAPEIARLGLVGALRKAVEVEFGPAFAEVGWECAAGVEAQAASLSPLAAETLYFAAREVVRNAAKHARPAGEAGPPCLDVDVQVAAAHLEITIQDNGPGMEPAAGAGHGLELHSTLMAIAGGSLALETIPGEMTRARLAMPLP